jgi:hypothetical protein
LSGANANTHCNIYSNGYSHIHTYADIDSYSHSDIYAYRYSYIHTDSYGYCYSNVHAYAYSNAECDADAGESDHADRNDLQRLQGRHGPDPQQHKLQR